MLTDEESYNLQVALRGYSTQIIMDEEGSLVVELDDFDPPPTQNKRKSAPSQSPIQLGAKRFQGSQSNNSRI